MEPKKHRIKISILIFAIGLLFLASSRQYFHFCLLEKRLVKQQEMQHFSILFAEELRRTTNEMTSMARCYIASGHPQYIEKFKNARDVHDGLAPREVAGDQSILSILANGGIFSEPIDKHLPFMEIASRAGFTDLELDMLGKADEVVDRLNEVDLEAIQLAEEDPGSLEQRQKALNMLVSEEYLATRDEAMGLMDEFQGLVTERTQTAIQREEKIARRIRYLLIGLGLLFSVSAFGGFLVEYTKAEKFKDGAQTDALTNLASRRYLHEHVEKATDAAIARGEIVLLAFLDLNGFKSVNDRYGHRKGDELLRTVAKSLHAQCRESDFVARYGGDEFVIVFVSLKKFREESIDRMKKTIERAFREIRSNGIGAELGVAVGISVFPIPAPTMDELIRMADEAMYEAKAHDDKVSIVVYGVEDGLSGMGRNIVADEPRPACSKST